MKVSEASSQNSVTENKLILLEGRIVLKRLEKPSLLGLMENLKTTEFQFSLEILCSESREKLGMK